MGSGEETVQFGLRLNQSTLDGYRALTKQHGNASVSALMRRGLDKFLLEERKRLEEGDG